MTAQIKLVIAGIVLAIIAAIIGVIWYEHHEVKALTTANAIDTSTIAAQATSVSEAHAAVVTGEQSAQITENTQIQAASETAATNTAAQTINTDRQTAEQEVIQDYASAPAVTSGAATSITPPHKIITIGKTTIDTSKTTEANALSAVRIQSMWDTYCQLNSKNANASACAANQ